MEESMINVKGLRRKKSANISLFKNQSAYVKTHFSLWTIKISLS